MAYIKIDETNRITAASRTHHCGAGEIEVEIPDEVWAAGVHNYKYTEGVFVFDPLPEPVPEESENTDTSEASVWDELDAAYQEGVDSV